MDNALIRKTPGVCGGAACIRDHRMPVWLLVEMKRADVSEARMLEDYPFLEKEDLQAAWDYYEAHQREIERSLWENEACMIEHSGSVDPQFLCDGKRLGFSDEEIRESFHPPLSQGELNRAWASQMQSSKPDLGSQVEAGAGR